MPQDQKNNNTVTTNSVGEVSKLSLDAMTGDLSGVNETLATLNPVQIERFMCSEDKYGNTPLHQLAKNVYNPNGKKSLEGKQKPLDQSEISRRYFATFFDILKNKLSADRVLILLEKTNREEQSPLELALSNTTTTLPAAMLSKCALDADIREQQKNHNARRCERITIREILADIANSDSSSKNSVLDASKSEAASTNRELLIKNKDLLLEILLCRYGRDLKMLEQAIDISHPLGSIFYRHRSSLPFQDRKDTNSVKIIKQRIEQIKAKNNTDPSAVANSNIKNKKNSLYGASRFSHFSHSSSTSSTLSLSRVSITEITTSPYHGLLSLSF